MLLRDAPSTSSVAPQDERRIGELVAAEAELWIGTPFRWQGRVKGVGCDCKGLVAGVLGALGRAEAASLEALAGDYDERIDAGRLRCGLMRLFDAAPSIAPGDVLLLWHAGKAQHLGIALDERTMVHALGTGPRQVVRAPIGKGRLAGVWRLRAIGEEIR